MPPCFYWCFIQLYKGKVSSKGNGREFAAMNQIQLEQLEQQLHEQRTVIADTTLVSEPDLSQSIGEDTGELSGYDNHPADLGSEVFERSLAVSLNEHENFMLDDIDYALNKIKEGTYGKCEECGVEIPFERLEAMPTARYCMEHQELHEQRDAGAAAAPGLSDYREDRPIEEEILSPNVTKAADGLHENAWEDVASYNDRPYDLDENKE
jgi:DnaK suppressor protein